MSFATSDGLELCHERMRRASRDSKRPSGSWPDGLSVNCRCSSGSVHPLLVRGHNSQRAPDGSEEKPPPERGSEERSQTKTPPTLKGMAGLSRPRHMQ